MPTQNEYIRLQGTNLHQTEKAIHFTISKVNGIDIEPVTHWFPISQIKSMTTSSPLSKIADRGDVLEVSKWICELKELL